MKNLTEKEGKRVIVLDTSAFVAGFDPFSISEEQYTVPMVKEEMTKSSMPSLRFKTAMESGKIIVETPDKTFLKMVKESATIVGDTFFLSETDLQVLALALELKTKGHNPSIVTDDYSIQNVANQIGIGFTSLATFGIRFRLKWLRYCPACRREYSPGYRSKVCEVCGTELKRKPLKKSHLNL
jgi:UPF0271 protein